MARLHAHRKGKSGSTRPYLKSNPEWVAMEKAESATGPMPTENM